MANPGERRDIEEKVELIAERIVRGKEAKKNRVVFFYRLNRLATILASALTGMGVSNPLLTIFTGNSSGAKLQEAFTSFNGFPIWLSVLGITIFVLLFVARQFFVEEGYEKKAIQSISVYESFVALETDFRGRLQNKDPMPKLNEIHENALALENSFAQIMPSDDSCVDKIQDYVNNLIKVRLICKYWDSTMPEERL